MILELSALHRSLQVVHRVCAAQHRELPQIQIVSAQLERLRQQQLHARVVRVRLLLQILRQQIDNGALGDGRRNA